MGKPNVVSFSGGRTSAYMVWLFEQKRKRENIDVEYVFCDTGAEHPKTYKFIRDVVEHFGIELTCLRTKVSEKAGVGCTYEVCSLDDCGPDLKPFYDLCRKYGMSSFNAPICTREMKTNPNQKYCRDKYGREGYFCWLGIRIDEPKRMKTVDGQKDLFAVAAPEKHFPIRYLGQISDFTKEDVLSFWGQQDFDLEITEELGNCVFCIKKSTMKVALAAKKEPEMAADFIKMINADDIIMQGAYSKKHGVKGNINYRGYHSLESIIASHKEHSIDELERRVKGGRKLDAGSCSESCEAIELNMDLFDVK